MKLFQIIYYDRRRPSASSLSKCDCQESAAVVPAAMAFQKSIKPPSHIVMKSVNRKSDIWDGGSTYIELYVLYRTRTVLFSFLSILRIFFKSRAQRGKKSKTDERIVQLIFFEPNLALRTHSSKLKMNGSAHVLLLFSPLKIKFYYVNFFLQ